MYTNNSEFDIALAKSEIFLLERMNDFPKKVHLNETNLNVPVYVIVRLDEMTDKILYHLTNDKKGADPESILTNWIWETPTGKAYTEKLNELIKNIIYNTLWLSDNISKLKYNTKEFIYVTSIIKKLLPKISKLTLGLYLNKELPGWVENLQ